MRKFGEYLKRARIAAGISTQQGAADEVRKLGRKISQGLIAQYETGRITDPDPSILRLIAEAYRKDYMELVYQLVRDKYEPDSEWTQPGIALERWRFFEAGLKRFPRVGEVKDEELEEYQLRAKVQMVDELQVLDVDGVMAWSRKFPDLALFWVMVPNFLDDIESSIFDHVVSNIKERDVKYIYFVPTKETKEGGRFWNLKLDLVQSVGKERAEAQVKAVILDEEQTLWLKTDHVIANPHWRIGAVGFQYFRRMGRPTIAIRMENSDLYAMIRELRGWVIKSESNDYSDQVMLSVTSQKRQA